MIALNMRPNTINVMTDSITVNKPSVSLTLSDRTYEKGGNVERKHS